MNETNVSAPRPSNGVWFGVSLGLMGIIVGYTLASLTGGARNGQVVDNPPSAPSSIAAEPTVGPVPPVDTKTDYIRGNPDARLTLITYSDYECPFSKRHHPTLAQILDAYKSDVNVVYRHFPLSFHQNAQKEAEAAECVGALAGNEAFWKFTDAIYEKTTSNGTGFALDALAPLAKSLGVNQTKFQECLDKGTYAKKVTDEEEGGASAGVRGTPGNILIDNKTKETQVISGAMPFDTFKSAIDAALAK